MIIRTLWAMLLSIALVFSLRADDHDKIPVRVVVVTTFESGGDNGPNASGEIANWVEQLPLKEKIEFPQGYHHLRYNRDLQVLGIVSGEGKSHAAASIMALEMDPRFDLSKAYWCVAAIAGVDPNKASVGSTAWAKCVVDGDLSYEIDARDIPAGWPTGIVAVGRATPYQPPAPPFETIGGHVVFKLNESLVNWAFELTKGIALPDDATLRWTHC
jgi:purine nucleoside permease